MSGFDAAAFLEARRAAFLAARPVRVPSFLVTLFGDVAGDRLTDLSIRALVALAAEFGVGGGAVRTAMSRLVAEGLFRPSAEPGRAAYGLTEAGAARFADAFERVYGGAGAPAGWRLVVLAPGEGRGAEAKRLAKRGFRPLAPGVFIARGPAAAEGGAFQFHAEGLGATDETLLRLLADDPARAAAFGAFSQDWGALAAAIEAGAGAPPATAFALRLLALHQFRRLVLGDPGLGDPAQGAARTLMARLHHALQPDADAFLADFFQRAGEPSPPPTPAMAARFRGGFPNDGVT